MSTGSQRRGEIQAKRQALQEKYQSLNDALEYYQSKVAEIKRDLLTYDNVIGFKLQRVRMKKSVRIRPAVDFKSLGITTKEAKEKLGGKTIKALLNSSVQFTWRPYTKERQGDDGFTHNGEYYGACERNEQTVVMPFKAWREFWRFITFDQPPRSGILPPGTKDYWIAVASCLSDAVDNGGFEGTSGVDELATFINNYIATVSKGSWGDNQIEMVEETGVAHERPQSTLITIRNVQYHNLNTAQPSTPINELPMGFFATHLSHQALYHPIQPSKTWDDMFVPEPTPKSFEGLDAVCVIKGLVNAIIDSFDKRAEKNGYNHPDSLYRTNFEFLWDLVHNTREGDDGSIYNTRMYTQNGKEITKRYGIRFVPRDDPDYYDYREAGDLRITLKQAERLFEHFNTTVVVIDDQANEIYRFDRKRDPEWRSHITFVAKNGHLYLCPDCKNSTVVARLQQQAPNTFHDMRLTDRFRLPKNDDRSVALMGQHILNEGCVTYSFHRVLYQSDWESLPDYVAQLLSSTDAHNYQIFAPSRKEDRSWTNDLLPLFYHLMHHKQFQAEIFSLRDRSFGRLRLRNFVRASSNAPSWYPKGISVTIQALSPNVTTIEEEDLLQSAKDMLFRRIFIQTAMSALSNSAKEWYGNVIGGLIGNLIRDPEGAIDRAGCDPWILEIDIKSQHPFALSKIKFIPVLNPFDDVQMYDGHPIEKYTSYAVEWHVPNHCCRNYAICSGMELMHYKPTDYTITHYLRPSKLIPSHVFDEMMRFNESSDLPDKLKKQATLPICGMLGKCANSASSITHFTSKEEALHYRNRYKGSTVVVETIDGYTYWTVRRQVRVQMIEGYRPLYFMMLGMSRLQQWQNIQQISKKATVLQTVTDAVRFILPDEAINNMPDIECGQLPHYVMTYLGLADQMLDKRKPLKEQVGKLKLIELVPDQVKGAYTKGTCILDRFQPINLDHFIDVDRPNDDPMPPSDRVERVLNMPCLTTPRVRQYTLPDEYDNESTLAWLQKQLKVCTRLFVKGEKPGVGKSALAKLLSDMIKADGGKVLYLAQYWETVLEFAQKGDISSLYSAFCIAFNGQDLSDQEEVTSKGKGKGTKRRLKKKGIGFANYRMVVIDEIFTADIPSCRRILQVLIKKFPKLIIISNGDVGQLEPVNTDAINNIVSDKRRSYYEGIIDRMFPHQLLLTKVKRVRCKVHEKEYTLPEIRDCPDCQKLTSEYVGMVDGMRASPHKGLARGIMLDKFKIIRRWDQIVSEDITSAVSYTNSMAEVVNGIIHVNEARKAGHEGEMYYAGMKLVCKKSMRLAQTADEEDQEVDDDVDEDEEEEEGSKRVRTYTNHPYVIVDVHKAYLVLQDTIQPMDSTDPVRFKVSRIKRKNAYRAQLEWFELPYCRTGHGWQGKSNDEKFLILESEHRHVTTEWLVVVATRNINPENVYVYVGDDLNELKKEVDERKHLEMCEREVMRYKNQDIKQFGELDHADDDDPMLRYPTRKEYADLLEDAVGTQCPHPACQNIIGMEQGRHSWDRINNRTRHWVSNCRFVCSLNCNSSMRPN